MFPTGTCKMNEIAVISTDKTIPDAIPVSSFHTGSLCDALKDCTVKYVLFVRDKSEYLACNIRRMTTCLDRSDADVTFPGAETNLASAVLTGKTDCTLTGKLFRSSALKRVLDQLSGFPDNHFEFLIGAAVLICLKGCSCPGKKTVCPQEVPVSAFPEYRRFGVWARQQSHDGVSEFDYLMQTDSFTYRMIAGKLESQPLSQTRQELPFMTEVLDSRLLYFATCWYQRELLSQIRFQHRQTPSGSVKNIAIFCRRLKNGGAERCAVLLAAEWLRSGYKVIFFTAEAATDKDYTVPPDAERKVLPLLPHERRAVLEMEFSACQIDTCIFFDHAEWLTPNDILCAHEAGIRTIAMEHSSFAYPWYIGSPEIAIERDCVYPAADIVTVLSRADRTMWREKGIGHCLYMPNPPVFDPDKVPESTGKRAKTMLFVARLSSDKGADKALAVLRKVLERHPDAKLLFLGRADTETFDAKLHEEAEKLGNSVEFAGFVTDIEPWFRRASLLLMPSAFEGFPMTLMEAKAFAIPTVLFCMPYLENAKHGCLAVPQQDTDAMAEAVCDLFDHPEKIEQLGQAAKNSLALFTMPAVRGHWESLFRFLSSGTPSAEEFFCTGETAEESAEQLVIVQQELSKAWKICLNHPDFQKKCADKALTAYWKEHPVSHVIARIGQILPRLCRAGNFLLSHILAGTLFRKIAEKLLPEREKGGRNGFPPYA